MQFTVVIFRGQRVWGLSYQTGDVLCETRRYQLGRRRN